VDNEETDGQQLPSAQAAEWKDALDGNLDSVRASIEEMEEIKLDLEKEMVGSTRVQGTTCVRIWMIPMPCTRLTTAAITSQPPSYLPLSLPPISPSFL